MAGHITQLAGRGAVRATGADAGRLLDSLITNEIDALATQPAIHAGLLSPQGKILFAFFVVRAGDDYLLDVDRDQAAGLAKRLNFYKLRAAVQFVDISSEMTVVAAFNGATPAVPRGVLAYPDPRHAALGQRLLLPTGRLPEIGTLDDDADAYAARRVALGVPQEGPDYPLTDTFPHEADFDLFHGVSFAKGCFIGQEVVSRMQNKTVVRKRVVRISGEGLATGGEIMHGAGVVGTIGTVAGHDALALLRLDRAVEADDRGTPLTVAGKPVSVAPADLDRYRASVRNKPVIDL